jgi:hypothetical protein
VASFVVVVSPLAVLAVLGAVVFVVVALLKPNFLAPALVLVALPLMRPNTLGERYSVYALGLCGLAALVVLIGNPARFKISRPFLVVFAMVVLMYLWAGEAQSFSGQPSGSLWQGMAITAGTVLSVGLVCGDAKRLHTLGRLFVWGVLALCASYVVTFLVWRIFGIGALQLATFGIDSTARAQATLFFPFTPSFGTQTIAGVTFPRFTGLGREPGWMGMYCAVAFLIWGRVGKPRMIGRAVLLAGLLGTFSTAAFGAFAVALGVAWIARSALQKNPALHYFGLLFKLAFLGAALWVAIYAPVVGFADKASYNAVSLDQRTQATNAGIAALTEHPLGGVFGGQQEAINLVAAIAPFGIPFALIVVAALLLPRIGHPAKHLTTAPIFVVFVTLLLSQPAGDSTFVFLLVPLVYGVARTTKGSPPDEEWGAVEPGATGLSRISS